MVTDQKKRKKLTICLCVNSGKHKKLIDLKATHGKTAVDAVGIGQRRSKLEVEEVCDSFINRE
jgi:hypothetical protein